MKTLITLFTLVFASTAVSAQTDYAFLLKSRDAVWRAWFAGDESALRRYLPENTVAINAGEQNWQNREQIIAAAKQFKKSGARLVKLQFPRTDIREAGNVAVLYSLYIIETELRGRRSKQSGRASEVFVRVGNSWTNPGWHLDSGQ